MVTDMKETSLVLCISTIIIDQNLGTVERVVFATFLILFLY